MALFQIAPSSSPSPITSVLFQMLTLATRGTKGKRVIGFVQATGTSVWKERDPSQRQTHSGRTGRELQHGSKRNREMFSVSFTVRSTRSPLFSVNMAGFLWEHDLFFGGRGFLVRTFLAKSNSISPSLPQLFFLQEAPQCRSSHCFPDLQTLMQGEYI